MSIESGKRRRLKSHKKSAKKEPAVVDFVKNPSFTDEANCEIFKQLESKAHEAINAKKVFTIVGGFEAIRQSFLARGWIERAIDVGSANIDEKMIEKSRGSYDITRIVLSRLVKAHTSFIWQPKYFDGIATNIHNPFRNRISRLRTSDFTLKEGLHNLVENIHWHLIDGVSLINYPRSFLLMDVYQRDFFVQEFRRTVITSFLFFLNTHPSFDSLFSDESSISFESIIPMSISHVEYFIKVKQHLCVDLEVYSSNAALDNLIKSIDFVVNQKKKIRFPDYYCGFSMSKLRENIKICVAEIHVNWPHTKYDGYRNIWIVKPINKSRGYGVVLMKDLCKIFDHVSRHPENKYIIQKYCGKEFEISLIAQELHQSKILIFLELPLLIHRTKFDIRQYFLTVITRSSVNIWSYKNCYIKFSSQEFNLDNLHESVHLTNNSIQVLF